MSELLIGARAVQFASSLLVTGAASFSTLVARPALRASSDVLVKLQARLTFLILAAGALAVLSGASWVLAVAAEISGASPDEALSNGSFWLVLSSTEFGLVSLVRFALLILLTVLIAVPFSETARDWTLLAIAVVFTASLAACGHAGAGLGANGDMHFANDAIHLTAASFWAGGLLPLLLSLSAMPRPDSERRYAVLRRFSALAGLSVAALVASGIVNGLYLVGRVANLVHTGYGQVLLAKIFLFAAMLSLAALNRYWFMPRIADGGWRTASASRLLHASIGGEIALALAIAVAVAVLGQMEPPALPP